MSTPALSVLLPNYNHADFLPQCLDAILGQSFTDFEVIVIDDCSTDGGRSVEVLEGYARRDPRVRFLRNPENLGVIGTLVRALALARGTWVLGAAADDYVLPGYFAQAMGLLADHPRAGMCLGLTECVDGNGRVTSYTPSLWSAEAGYIPPAVLAGRMDTCGVPGPAIWNKAAFLKAGGYRAALRWHGDWFPLQVVALRHGVCFIPREVSVVREVAGSYSANQRRVQTQRAVLRHLLGLVASDEFRDVFPLFSESGVIRQFGPEVVRAAVTDPDCLPILHGALRPLLLRYAHDLLHDDEREVRVGAAEWIGRCGAVAFPGHYELLGVKKGDPDPAVVAAARDARRAIRRELPARRVAKYHVRAVAGTALRTIDRFARPLHHRRLERVEALLAEMVSFQKNEMYQAMSALYHQLDAIKRLQTPPAADEPAAGSGGPSVRRDPAGRPATRAA